MYICHLYFFCKESVHIIAYFFGLLFSWWMLLVVTYKCFVRSVVGVLFYTVLAFLPTATDRSGLTIKGLAPQCSVMVHGFLCFHLKHQQQMEHHRDFPFLFFSRCQSSGFTYGFFMCFEILYLKIITYTYWIN